MNNNNKPFRLHVANGVVGFCPICQYSQCRNPLCLKESIDETTIFKRYGNAIIGINGMYWSTCNSCVHADDESVCVDGALKTSRQNQYKIRKLLGNNKVQLLDYKGETVKLRPHIYHRDGNRFQTCGKSFTDDRTYFDVFEIKYLY